MHLEDYHYDRHRIQVNMTPSRPGDFIRTEVIDELGLNASRAAAILGVRRSPGPISSTVKRYGNRLDLGELQANRSPAVSRIVVDTDRDHLLPVVGGRHGARLALQSRRKDDSHPNTGVHAGIVGTR